MLELDQARHISLPAWQKDDFDAIGATDRREDRLPPGIPQDEGAAKSIFPDQGGPRGAGHGVEEAGSSLFFRAQRTTSLLTVRPMPKRPGLTLCPRTELMWAYRL